MQRLLTLVFLFCLAIPAGISITGCTRNPAGNYCNGEGYGLKLTDVASIDLEPRTTGISLAFGQTQQIAGPTAKTCKGNTATVSGYNYGSNNLQLVDVSPNGNLCAGTWNRRSGGGIPDYTICNFPSPLPSTGGEPYASTTVTASANSVTSNQVTVYVHPQVTAVSLVLEQPGNAAAIITGCLSQTQTAQLDAKAFYDVDGVQTLLCEPNSGTIPSCSTAIGNLSYTPQTPLVGTIDQFGVITALDPGTTAITASVAGSGSSAGYFSTCPPASISVTLNGKTSGTVTQGVTQNLVTTIIDTKGNQIQGLTLDYQSTNPLDISAGVGGAVTANFAGSAAVYAVCQPFTCNPSPINKVGVNQTGTPITSNAVTINTPGIASDYVWLSSPVSPYAPGVPQITGLSPSVGSQYFVPVELLSGSVGSPVKMPYVPNSMVMDRSGTNLYFGSSHELMIYSTAANTLSREDANAPGVVLAAAPNNQLILVNDQVRKLFYLYTVSSSSFATFSGVGTAAQWTPDSKTLYVVGTDANGTPTLFVNSVATGWTTYPLTQPVTKSPTGVAEQTVGATSVAVTVPGVGAFLSGFPTVVNAWCPYVSPNHQIIQAYPEAGSVDVPTQVVAATTDGDHILGVNRVSATSSTLYDIGVSFAQSLDTGACPSVASGGTFSSTYISTSPITTPAPAAVAIPLPANVQVNTLNQVVVAPSTNLAFVTYSALGASTGTATLPSYQPSDSGPGTIEPVSLAVLNGATPPTAPLAGAFSLDDTIFFVSTSGDNLVHYINVKTLTDKQQIMPGLVDNNGNVVPATAIAVKPRPTT